MKSTTKTNKKRLTPHDFDTWKIEVSLSNTKDELNTKVCFEITGNPSGLINGLKTHLTFFHYNYYAPFIAFPLKMKYISSLHPNYIAKGGNKVIFKDNSKVKSSLKSRAVLTTELHTEKKM